MPPFSLLAYMFVPLLERPIEGGGEGPPVLLVPAGKPLALMVPLEPPELGGEARFPRLFGYAPSSGEGYFEKDHSLPPTETGESGALRPTALMIVRGY